MRRVIVLVVTALALVAERASKTVRCASLIVVAPRRANPWKAM